MSTEPESTPKRAEASAQLVWWLIPALLLGYPLGMVPLAIFCRWGVYVGLLPRQATFEFLETLAAPFYWLAQMSDILSQLLDFFLNVINRVSP
jgi:hypothetical protein